MSNDVTLACQTAWEQFGTYYRASQPVRSDGDGNTATINGERQAVQYLSLFLQLALGTHNDLGVQLEFPIDAGRLDLAIVERSHWLNIEHALSDQRRLVAAAEFKCLLRSNDEAISNNYNLRAIKADCQKLQSLVGRADQLIMCIVVRRRELPTGLETLVTEFPSVKVLSHHVPP
jgi:hypothetical protein